MCESSKEMTHALNILLFLAAVMRLLSHGILRAIDVSQIACRILTRQSRKQCNMAPKRGFCGLYSTKCRRSPDAIHGVHRPESGVQWQGLTLSGAQGAVLPSQLSSNLQTRVQALGEHGRNPMLMMSRFIE